MNAGHHQGHFSQRKEKIMEKETVIGLLQEAARFHRAKVFTIDSEQAVDASSVRDADGNEVTIGHLSIAAACEEAAAMMEE